MQTIALRKLLSPRFAHPGAPSIRLSALQLSHRSQIEEKLLNGFYQNESSHCLFCDSDQDICLAEIDRFGLAVSTMICTGCGLLRSNPRLRQNDLIDFYKNHYRALYDNLNSPDPSHFRFQVRYRGEPALSFVNRHCKIPDNAFVLEVGASCGGVLYPFAKVGYKTIGIDYDESFMNYGRKMGLDLRYGSIQDVDLNEAPALTIYSHVLEHIFDPVKELKSLFEKLPYGAYVYVEVPGLRNISLFHSYLGDFRLYLQNAHLFHFSLATLQRLFWEIGFKLVSGDETIRAVFVKSESPGEFASSNEFAETYNFLTALEQRQAKFKHRILRYVSNQILIPGLMTQQAKKIYHRFFLNNNKLKGL